jgi:cytochrome c553
MMRGYSRDRVFRDALLALALAALAACQPKPVSTAELDWAYPKAPDAPLPQAPAGVYRVPGSALSVSADVLNDHTPDWFPNEHPPAPTVVSAGRKPGPEACSNCHNYNGAGYIGVPDLAGLPASYIVEQIHEFRSGRRRSTQPGRPSVQVMTQMAKQVTDQDLSAAAAYYAALKRPHWYRVVETTTVPKTVPDHYGWRDLDSHGGVEPIQGRLIELPEDAHRMLWMSDPHVGVVVYAPPGSVASGAVLAHSGGAGGQPCTSCHGADLKGLGEAPPLAGRSAAYLARELWDIKGGARSGPAVALMQGPAKGLGAAQVRDVAAYLSSLDP